jgi:radical SAM superfamily enzyme YgiQ (UPF0313 family)
VNRAHQVTVEPLPRADLFAPEFVQPLVENCDLLGISSNSINWRFARKLSLLARAARPDLRIVLGGIHASLFPEHAIEISSADYVLRGEAEYTFPELVNAITSGKGFEAIAGLTYRDRQEVVRSNPAAPLLTREQLASQPAPAFDLLPENEYHGIAIESARGCAFNCVFCSIPYRRSFRDLSAAMASVTWSARASRSMSSIFNPLLTFRRPSG